MNGEDFVWHFVLVRRGRPPSSGERLGTLVLPATRVASIGEQRMKAAIAHEERRWRRVAIAAGYVDDHVVVVVAERGFRRSLFPAAAIPGLASVPKPDLVKV